MPSNFKIKIRHSVIFKLNHPAGSPVEKMFLAEARKRESIPGVKKFELVMEISVPETNMSMGFRWNLRISRSMISIPIIRIKFDSFMKFGSRLWKFLWRLIIWFRNAREKYTGRQGSSAKSNHNKTNDER